MPHEKLPQPADSPDLIIVAYDYTLVEYMIGQLEVLTRASTFESGGDIEQTLARFNQLIIDLQTPMTIPDIQSYTRTIPVESFAAIVGEPWTLTHSIVSNVPFNFLLLNNTTPAIGDKIRALIRLGVGNYSARIRYVKSSVYGVYNFALDNTAISIDMYAAAFTLSSSAIALFNVSDSTTDVAVTLECMSKNASSTGYYAGIFDVIVTRLPD